MILAARSTGSSTMPSAERAWIALVGLLACGLSTFWPAAARAAAARRADPWVLSTDSFTPAYNPTYIGNGYMGTRVPAEGEGYSSSPVETDARVAGVYQQTVPGTPAAQPPAEETTAAVAVPQWTGLPFVDGSDTWSTSIGTALAYRQTLDLLNGALTTSVRWRSTSGHVTGLRYEVLVDRARLHVGLVTLTITPEWTGTASVDDILGPGGGIGSITGPTLPLLVTTSSGGDPASATNRFVARTPSVEPATIAETSRLSWSTNVVPSARTTSTASQKSTLQITFPVTAGQTYQFRKVVAIATSVDSSVPAKTADDDSAQAQAVGAAGLIAESAAAWRALWRSRIDIVGDPRLSLQVHASQFYLLGSFDKNVFWSSSPGGLSSNGYSGHVFWDTETWMYPALLIGHPAIAAAVDAYRQRLLPGAEAYAHAGGYQGARFPWESADTGAEEAPPPYGTLEQHISSDVALAQWQYFLATGDRAWLSRAWPLISGVADFWASRATASGNSYSINDVMPPDEYDFPVDNSAYTNVAAITSLQIAQRAARILGKSVPAQWATVADGLVVPFDPTLGIHPDYDGYNGKQIKQADTVMLTYPWEYSMPKRVADADLDYYVPRTDPTGPSMSDSVHAIDTLALARAGCASYTFMRQSLDPFVRPPFDQLSETRGGGTFDFLTGTGGFLQTFYYGFSGFRWRANTIHLNPNLPPQMRGVILRNLAWHGRTFTVAIGPRHTTVTLISGPPAPVTSGRFHRVLGPHHPVILRTQRPDLDPTTDVARCKPITAAASAQGYLPNAANDGSLTTSWIGAHQTDALTIDLERTFVVRSVRVWWGQTEATSVQGFNASSKLARAQDYAIDLSTNHTTWRRVIEVHGGSATVDELHFKPTKARYVRLVPQTVQAGAPSVAEFGVPGQPLPQRPNGRARRSLSASSRAGD
jgi:trehalose/maltose hydrolase-like predicted phosphorylase